MHIKVTQKELDNSNGDGGIQIYIEGCTGNPQEKAPGCVVFIEKYIGNVLLHVWDGTEQDPKTFTLKEEPHE